MVKIFLAIHFILWYNIYMSSQVEPNSNVQKLVEHLHSPFSAATLENMRSTLHQSLEMRSLHTQDDIAHERLIRWKRSATQILEDKYVYQGKMCTDVSVVFISMCLALGLEARLVKLKKTSMTHSVVEVLLHDGWYVVDASNQQSKPIKGEITEDNPYYDWTLWKKAPDAWSMGLDDVHKIASIF
jgi:hypothetical protein